MDSATSPITRRVVDCDVHPAIPRVETLFPYLSAHWVEYMTQSAFRGPVDTSYPKGYPNGGSVDATVSEPASLAGAVLRGPDDQAILNCLYAVDSVHNPDTAHALARAVNDWVVDRWLSADARFRASIVVNVQQPSMASAEIDRVAGNRGFVQVLLPVRTRVGLGDPLFNPIYEAAVRHELPVGVHFGGAPGNAMSGDGWDDLYVEEYAGMAAIAQVQISSLVGHDVFGRFPALRLTFLEMGWRWVGPLMGELDRAARGMHRRFARGTELPSTMIRAHTRFGLTPGYASNDVVRDEIASAGLADLLLFTSDFPHVHGSDPTEVLKGLGPARAHAIEAANAREWYPRLGDGER